METSKADQLREFFVKTPDGTHEAFVAAYGPVSLRHYHGVRRASRLNSPSMADHVRAFLKKNPHGMRAEFMAETGLKVASSHFSVLKAHFLIPEGTSPTAVTAAPPSGDPKTKLLEEALVLEKNENGYLRWLLEGERKGYLDRAMRELSGD